MINPVTESAMAVLTAIFLASLALPGGVTDGHLHARLAERVLQSEALYTVTGGLKPVSEGFWQARIPESDATSPAIERVRALLGGLPLGPDIASGVYLFHTPFGGMRSASAFVAHRPSLARLIGRHAGFFARLGITPETPPQRALEMIDRAEAGDRWRGFGLAFGYPEYAVDFFVEAGESERRTKAFVKREFLNYPTFEGDRGRFVYAVPVGHQLRAEDYALRTATSAIIARYTAWRKVYYEPGMPGPVELLRLWVTPPVPPACPIPAGGANRISFDGVPPR